MKKIFEKVIEGILMLSGTVTTLTVLLIIFFLFKEGIGLFGKSPTEEGFTVAVNRENPVNELSTDQIKNIFDQNIHNWNEVGGNNDSIILFRMDDLFNYYTEEELAGIDTNMNLLTSKIDEVIDKNKGIIAFISSKEIPQNPNSKLIHIKAIGLGSFFGGKEWFPTAQPVAQFGVYPLLMGTLWVSLLAILIALPFGLATAVYMAEIASPGVRSVLKPVIELLAGIPSVVYGFFGLIVVVPLVQQIFALPVGETGLTGSIILAIMALPTIITVAEDAIRGTPRSVKEASLALGASQWQTIYRITIPYASSGITAAVILGIGRAIGETMAVLMVTGNAAVVPHSILEPMRTIPATIAAELGEAAKGSLHYDALFALGCILFIITMIVNLTVQMISGKRTRNKLR
ncbi:MAG: phosphate ABC transporter permease subunit PstC [Bacteroidota bacterium]|nr:phosphate ABC transporter permease subunit PstC [Bacteroidota bacterium]